MHTDEKASYKERFKEWALKYRVGFIIVTACLGVLLFVVLLGGFYSVFPISKLRKESEVFSRILFIALAVPVSFYFWYLRNNDKLESIEQAKRGNQLNVFSNATTLFFEKENLGANAAGIRLLLNLRNEFNVYQQEIDLMIRFRNLSDMNLQGVNLQKMDLQSTNLMETDLQGANLRGANLQSASLQCANLRGADLRGTNLQGANLQLANLQLTNLQLTNLQLTDLQNADLQNANLQNTKLQGAHILINPNDLQKTYSRAELEHLLKNPTATDEQILVYIIEDIEDNDQYSFERVT